MSNLTLSLPDDLQKFVVSEAEAGQFAGPAAYVQALLERVKAGKTKLTALLLEGLDSGDPIELDAAEWTRIRRDVQQRLTHG